MSSEFAHDHEQKTRLLAELRSAEAEIARLRTALEQAEADAAALREAADTFHHAVAMNGAFDGRFDRNTAAQSTALIAALRDAHPGTTLLAERDAALLAERAKRVATEADMASLMDGINRYVRASPGERGAHYTRLFALMIADSPGARLLVERDAAIEDNAGLLAILREIDLTCSRPGHIQVLLEQVRSSEHPGRALMARATAELTAARELKDWARKWQRDHVISLEMIRAMDAMDAAMKARSE